jgi:hypothetical protein
MSNGLSDSKKSEHNCPQSHQKPPQVTKRFSINNNPVPYCNQHNLQRTNLLDEMTKIPTNRIANRLSELHELLKLYDPTQLLPKKQQHITTPILA